MWHFFPIRTILHIHMAFSCPVCCEMTNPNAVFVGNECGHLICEACINGIIGEKKCPLCRRNKQRWIRVYGIYGIDVHPPTSIAQRFLVTLKQWIYRVPWQLCFAWTIHVLSILGWAWLPQLILSAFCMNMGIFWGHITIWLYWIENIPLYDAYFRSPYRGGLLALMIVPMTCAEFMTIPGLPIVTMTMKSAFVFGMTYAVLSFLFAGILCRATQWAQELALGIFFAIPLCIFMIRFYDVVVFS